MWRSSILAPRCWSAPSINTVTSLHLYLRNAVSNSVGTESWCCQCGRKRGDGLHLALSLHPDTTTHTYSINIKCKHNCEQRHITCMVSRSLYGCFFCNQGFQHWTSLMSLLCFLLYTHNDNFIVHKANLLERKQWFIRCCVLTRPHI